LPASVELIEVVEQVAEPRWRVGDVEFGFRVRSIALARARLEMVPKRGTILLALREGEDGADMRD
jgi:hypothetical protein